MNCFAILVLLLRSIRRVVFLLTLVLLSCGEGHAQSWVGSVSADWSNANNWSPAGVPSGVTATVNTSSGNLATVLSAVTQQPSYLFVGNGAAGTMYLQTGGGLTVNGEMDVGNNNSGTGVFSMSGGRLTVNGWFEAGRLGGTTANGTVNLTGGTLTQTGGNFDIGEGTGTVNVSNAIVNVGGELWIGQVGNGTLTLANGGSINASNWVVVARGGGAGVFNLTGGAFTITYGGVNNFVIGNGNGTVNQSGGLLSAGGADLRICETGTGLYNMTGGTANMATVLVGSLDTGSAELRLSGSAAMIATTVILGNAGSMTSTVNLDGGNLQVKVIATGSGSGSKTFNFNGGTLKASGANGAFMSGLTTANVRNGGVIIDDSGFTIAIAQALVHSNLGGDNTVDGGLTKNGSGTLILSGVNTYTGDTVVNAGTLQLNVAGANAGALRLTNGPMVNLNFNGTTIVGAFYTNNVPLANGFYSASNLPGFITGSGVLKVGFASASYSYVDLIGRLTNLEQLAQLPAAGETSAEWTSRDRSSTYNSATGQYLNWGANNDGSGFISTQPDGGIVMAAMTGPGCIWRIWSGQAGAGHVEIFLDGSNTPAVDLPFANYFNGTQSPFIYPSLSYMVCEGLDSYVPIPYNVSCKVVAYGSWGNGYFHFNYSTFPPGVTVPTFTTNLTAIEQGALSNLDNYFMNNLGSDPAGVRSGETSTTNSYAVAPGQSITALNFTGQGAITAFKVRVNGMTGPSEQWEALRALTVSMSWDGETNSSVWAPLGDFFGTACGYIPYTALPLGMQTNGWMYCYWYMPFATQAQIVIGNDDSVTRNVDVVITRAPLTQPISNLARFHAKWNRGIYVTNNGRSPDYRFLATSGQGRFVGLAMHVYQTVDVTPGPWWGEGDEKFFVDGEMFPSWFGTGSEDYFGFSYGTPGYFTKAYHTQALAPPGTLYAPGNRALNRFHITDNVPFQASFEGCIEKWFYTNDSITTYGMMPYWYLTSGGSDPYSALPLSSRTNYYVPPYSFTWTNTAGGLWSLTGNWANGSVANGSGLGADFSALDLTANTTVHLDSARTIGSLIFGDTDITTPGGWILDNNGNAANTLNLAGGTPTITVNALGTGVTAAINAPMIAANGLTTTGVGTLMLGGTNSLSGLSVNGGTNIITGNTTINGNGGRIYVGDGDYLAGCKGTLVIQPGAVLNITGTFGDTFVIGRDNASGGTIIQNGGTFTFNPSNNQRMLLGATSNPNLRAEYDMNGGLLDMSGWNFSVGWGNQTGSTSLLYQIGGVITNVNEIRIPTTGGGSGLGVYTLSGGSVYLLGGGIVNDGLSYAINLGGGTVGAEANWASSLNMNLTNLKGSVTFDTTANTITLSGVLSGSGGLAKAGSGTLELSGSNTYTGDTTVNAGILKLNVPSMANTSAIHLANGAVLNLNFAGTNTVPALYTNNVALPPGHYKASNLPGFITGTGALLVSIPTAPTNIAWSLNGRNLALTWPATYLGWILQEQIDTQNMGLSTNWVDIAASTNVISTNMLINPANQTVFYRLRYPSPY
jgi:autotransporter-associated beta strand protein